MIQSELNVRFQALAARMRVWNSSPEQGPTIAVHSDSADTAPHPTSTKSRDSAMTREREFNNHRRLMKGATGWIALAVLITGFGDVSAMKGSPAAELEMSAKRVAVDDAVDRLASALNDGAATRLRITLNGLRQAMDNGNANAPALARAARIELDSYVRIVGVSEPDVDAIRLALEAVAVAT